MSPLPANALSARVSPDGAAHTADEPGPEIGKDVAEHVLGDENDAAARQHWRPGKCVRTRHEVATLRLFAYIPHARMVRRPGLSRSPPHPRFHSGRPVLQRGAAAGKTGPMKIRNSLKSLRGRHRENQIVRRKGRVYVINKTQKRYKARQG